jgi:Zn-dependent M28 family amino/carboxypeptidase
LNDRYLPCLLILAASALSACSKDATEDTAAAGDSLETALPPSALEQGLPLIERDSEVVGAEGFKLAPDPVTEEVLFIRSDQYSFVKKGAPSVFLVPGFTSTDPQTNGGALFSQHLQTHYQQPSDDLSRPSDWQGDANCHHVISCRVATVT